MVSRAEERGSVETWVGTECASNNLVRIEDWDSVPCQVDLVLDISQRL